MRLAPLGERFSAAPLEDGVGLAEVRAQRRRSRRGASRHAPARHEARRPFVSAVGVLVIVSCALAGAEVAGHADRRAMYLAVAISVPQGAVVSSDDLTVVGLPPATGLGAIPATQAASVIGRRASEPLQAGSLLVGGDVTSAGAFPSGEALVGSSLAPDQAPAGLAAGSSVLVVLGGQAGAQPGTTAALSGTAAGTAGTSGSGNPGAALQVTVVGTVYAISLPSTSDAISSTDETVTLEVPQADAVAVTAASAAGDLSLAQIFPAAS
ncbi:MAG: SAF domain-containing protein [Acidimicrobiales bacterium]|jgi:hypothetical protein